MGSAGIFSMAFLVIAYLVVENLFVTPPHFLAGYIIVSAAIILTALLGF